MFYRTDPTGRARAREHAFAGALGTSDLLVPLGRRDQPPAPGKPDSAMRDAREPPTTREEYVALIADAIADAAARAPPARRAVPPVDGERADRDRPSLERLAPPSARARAGGPSTPSPTSTPTSARTPTGRARSPSTRPSPPSSSPETSPRPPRPSSTPSRTSHASSRRSSGARGTTNCGPPPRPTNTTTRATPRTRSENSNTSSNASRPWAFASRPPSSRVRRPRRRPMTTTTTPRPWSWCPC